MILKNRQSSRPALREVEVECAGGGAGGEGGGHTPPSAPRLRGRRTAHRRSRAGGTSDAPALGERPTRWREASE